MDRPDDIARAKADLRDRLRAARAARPAVEVAGAGTRIAEVLLALPEVADARVVACTIAMAGEPPTAPVIDTLRARGTIVVVPRIEPGRQLSWHELRDGMAWRTHRFGIDEPAGEPRAQGLADVDAVLVPALAIGADGCRLGQGGGYYDRALEGIDASRTALVAVVFDDEVLDTVPCEPHDLRVGMVVTPSGVRRLPARA